MDRLVRRLAKLSKVSEAQAADQIHGAVHEIISKLRKGESVSVPGIGKFKPGRNPVFQQERPDGK
ncbi:MAG: HU family DNA-binding protein [Bryobacteraceae bacterium]